MYDFVCMECNFFNLLFMNYKILYHNEDDMLPDLQKRKLFQDSLRTNLTDIIRQTPLLLFLKQDSHEARAKFFHNPFSAPIYNDLNTFPVRLLYNFYNFAKILD